MSAEFLMYRNRQCALLFLALLAGCANAPNVAVFDGEETQHVEGKETAKSLERWECGDYINGCLFRCPIALTADTPNGVGTVKFADVVEPTRFEVRGLERRWDWCTGADGRYMCTFVLEADGTGLYYNFDSAVPDSAGVRRTKPSEVFQCKRRRARRAG